MENINVGGEINQWFAALIEQMKKVNPEDLTTEQKTEIQQLFIRKLMGQVQRLTYPYERKAA